MARGGGGGGLIARQRNKQQGVVSGPPPKLPGQGGGGGGRNHPNRNHRRPGLGGGGGGGGKGPGGRKADPAQEPPATNPYGDMLGTGPGGVAFNNKANAIAGAQGMLANGGVTINPQYQGQANFLNNQMQADYNEFAAKRIANPGNDQYTWHMFLQEKYGPDLPAGMSRSYADSYARASPTARGYFSGGWRGPGRTITG